ncbi:MAG: carbamoyltransferase HypF [Bacteroidota bacterium]
MIISKEITIKGLVQGVGFRPSVYRIAIKHNLHGTVVNNNTGVIIIVEGDEKDVTNFISDIPILTPIASSIRSLKVNDKDIVGYTDFKISKSISKSNDITEVSPDISICDDCLTDISSQPNRIDYPLTNCTNCGPRFTIIKDLPYDRSKTTMDIFPMCKKCEDEYTNILDRRFHAQPVACNICGPKYSLYYRDNQIQNMSTIISTTSRLIDDGKIMAIKGLGGYHLACDAFNSHSVNKLRHIKNRDGKPFALMFKDIDAARMYLNINKKEESLLTGWRKPIVLLNIKTDISSAISIGLNTIGAMLPYMAFHHMLFDQLKTNCIVLTSGNISDEPVIISNESALETFVNICDGIVTYNRDIHNRTDDSVTTIVNNTERTIRRSRGYAPSPLELNLNTEGIFASGAELVNCFAIGKGNQAIISQHIGDLKNLETLEFYEESVTRFSRLFRFKAELVVMDMHPDYLSSRYAEQTGIPSIKVQHHHAHIASCMAESLLDEKVIGVSFDGTGYGDDGNIWGGEFFICDLNEYKRITHFEYIMQPGGDAVTKHPWRMMTSYLYHYFGKDAINNFPFLFNEIDTFDLQIIMDMLDNRLNTPSTSSAGRLFDAVSAMLGVCRTATYHAEAPMQLESVADHTITGSYLYTSDDIISFKSTFEEIIEDLKNEIPISKISGKFHNTIVNVIVEHAIIIRKDSGINKVVLSGGSFQNKILLEKVEIKLAANNFEYFTQSQIPSNDGGIALGQLAIAAKRREIGKI